MLKIVSPDTMKNMDKRAMEEYSIPGIVLMENAGRKLAEQVNNIWENQSIKSSKKVVVFCGKGNNGGDGFVVARHLSNAGFDIHVFITADPNEIKGDALVNLHIIQKMDIDIHTTLEKDFLQKASRVTDGAFAVVDALFGTGLKGEVKGIALEVIELINSFDCHVIACDIPSGISGHTGQVLGTAVRAEETVTMALLKTGIVIFPGAQYTGKLTVADIGMPYSVIKEAETEAILLEKQYIADLFNECPLDAHKGDFGRVFVIAGSRGMSGAAALAGLASARSGAGLVTVGIPESLNDIIEMKLTEVMSIPLSETSEGSISNEALKQALEFAQKCNAVAIGPGLSMNDDTRQFVKQFVEDCKKPLVIDADGLNALSDEPNLLAETSLCQTVITPHPGEMARLLSTTTDVVQRDRIGAARAAASKLGSTVVLKGAGTLIVTPDGDTWINTTGNPGMATGGSGDVLTGIITAFIARGMKPTEAALAGVFIHGLAGDIAVEKMGGGISLIASDIIGYLHEAFKIIFS